MSQAFYDSFMRDDGPVGNGWVVQAGAFSILGHTMRATSAGRIQSPTPSASNNHVVEAVVETPSAFPKVVILFVRSQDTLANGYQLWFTLNATSIGLTLRRITGAGYTDFATGTYPYSWGTTVTLRAAAIGNNFYEWVDGELVLAGTNDTYPLGTYNGVYLGQTLCFVSTYSLIDLSPNALSISPDTAEAPGDPVDVTIYNGGNPWTPGTPGSPVLTADIGTLSDQTIQDADIATATYTPPTITLNDVIRDPLNETVVSLPLTTDLAAGSGGGGGGGIADAYFLAASTGGISSSLWVQILTALISLIPGGGDGWDKLWLILGDDTEQPSLQDAVQAVFDKVSTIETEVHTDSETPNTLYHQATGAFLEAGTAHTRLDALMTGNDWTLGNVKAWIEAIDTGDDQAILDAIAAIRTVNNYTLGTVLNDLWEMRTLSDYTLQDILNAIQAVPGYDDSAVLSAIAAVRGSGNPDLAALLAAINSIPTNPVTSLQPVLEAVSAHDSHLQAEATAILDAIADIPTNPVTDLSPVLNAITALSGQLTTARSDILAAIAGIPTGQSVVAPVWPGVASATVGQALAITNGLTYTGACDGAIVNLTSVPNGSRVYRFDDHDSYANIGQLAFFDDRGEFEQAQSFGFTSLIMTPRRMAHAAGFVVRTTKAIVGTVAPWSAN